MAKALRCKDVGFDCEAVCRAGTEEEILRMAAEHVRVAHNIEEISDEAVAKVRAAIRRDEAGGCSCNH